MLLLLLLFWKSFFSNWKKLFAQTCTHKTRYHLFACKIMTQIKISWIPILDVIFWNHTKKNNFVCQSLLMLIPILFTLFFLFLFLYISSFLFMDVFLFFLFVLLFLHLIADCLFALFACCKWVELIITDYCVLYHFMIETKFFYQLGES